MSVRQTSIDVLNEIKRSGLLSERREQVYESLFIHGPCTASELFYRMQNTRNPSHSNVTTRLGELRDMGVAYEVQERICTVTGRVVIEWDVTDKLPVKFERLKSKKCPHCRGTGVLTEPQQARFNL